MAICPECKKITSDVVIFCSNCGDELIPEHSEINGNIIDTSSSSVSNKIIPDLTSSISDVAVIPFPELPEEDSLFQNSDTSKSKIFTDDIDMKDTPDELIRIAAPFPDTDEEDEIDAVSQTSDDIYLPSSEKPEIKNHTVAQVAPVKVTDSNIVISSEHAASRNQAPFPDDLSNEAQDSMPLIALDAHPHKGGILTTVPAPVQWQDNECTMCGLQNEPDALYCGQCGSSLSMNSYSSDAETKCLIKIIRLSFDGAELFEIDLDEEGLPIDVRTGDVSSMNKYNADSHVLFRVTGNRIVIIPPCNNNDDIFVRIPSRKNVLLQSGSLLRIGNHVLLLETTDMTPGVWGVITILAPDPNQERVLLRNLETVIGRVNGDILFFDDPLVSSTHAKLINVNEKAFIYDMDSTNGTFQQVLDTYYPIPGQVFIIGPKIYKITTAKY